VTAEFLVDGLPRHCEAKPKQSMPPPLSYEWIASLRSQWRLRLVAAWIASAARRNDARCEGQGSGGRPWAC
jgi:hypothetical protein